MSTSLNEITSLSPTELKQALEAGVLQEEIRAIPRWQFLPHLFSVKGQPYSLSDYPAFKPLYATTYTPDFLLMAGRQVGKSSNLSRSEVLDAIQIPNFQILYVAPLREQSQRYSVLYLREAIATCRLAKNLQSKDEYDDVDAGSSLGVTKAVMHQTFLNGSGIQLSYAKTSSDRARGIYADRIDFDEIQDQLTEHIPVISESTTNSPWGVRRFTGTAKTTDNTIEHLWSKSSQGEWAMRCEGCNHWNIPNKDGNVLDMIRAEGTSCAQCGHLLSIRNGEWVHGHPDRLEDFPGYHVPQIIVPAIVYDRNKWAKVIRKVTNLPPSIIYTEVLGISSDIGVRLITQQDIDNLSVLGTHAELRAKINNYAFRVLGIDWGISEVSSFTVACVLGVRHDGQMDVIYGKKYVGQDPEEVIKDLVRLSHMYRADYVAPDFGVGYLNNALLRNSDLQVVQIQYVNSNKFLSYSPLHGHPRWTVDRTTALGVLFWNIRGKRICFPNKEESQVYTMDLLSPYEHISEPESGIARKSFLRDPAKPDDFAHALAFAMMVIFYLTGNPILNILPETATGYEGNEMATMTDAEAVTDMLRNI
jgi:hypothetical protein